MRNGGRGTVAESPLDERTLGDPARGVLVVCREPVERELALDLLRALGIRRLYACDDAAAAIPVLDTLRPPPLLALLDDTPGESRTPLLQALAGAAPPVPVVMIRQSSRFDPVCSGAATLQPALATVPLDGRALQDVIGRLSHGPDSASTGPPAGIDHALAAGHLTLDYLPRFTLIEGQVDGLEALPRLSLPGREITTAEVMAAAAKGSGRWAPLLDAMAERLAMDLARWPSMDPALRCSLSLPIATLAGTNAAERVLAALSRHGVPPHRLMLDLPERALEQDGVVSKHALGRLHRAGVQLAIAHFGSGQLPLQRLARLPITAMKIDSSLIRGAQTGNALHAILATSITVGRRLGLATIAMGIETPAELALLRSLGCAVGSGRALAGPMCADAVADWLAAGARLAERVATPCAR